MYAVLENIYKLVYMQRIRGLSGYYLSLSEREFRRESAQSVNFVSERCMLAVQTEAPSVIIDTQSKHLGRVIRVRNGNEPRI